MSSSQYDLIVIGTGPGGYVAAIRAAQLGLSVAVVEKDPSFGGTCLNIGCIPSKALLDSSALFVQAKYKGRDHGILADNVHLDLSVLMSRKAKIVKQLTSGIAALFKANGVVAVQGVAKIIAPQAVEVTSGTGKTEKLSSNRILIASGSRPAGLSSVAFDGEKIVSSREALAFTEVPAELVVIGAGAIGLELGSVWSRLGSKATLVELMPQILPGWDPQIARTLHRLLEQQGMVINTGCKVTGHSFGKQAVLEYDDSTGNQHSLQADKILVAVGRRPHTTDLGLAEIGIRTDAQSRIQVDGRFQTSVASIYAIGDVIRGPQLAHKAHEEGIAVAEQLAGKPGHISYDAIPVVVYTWPEVASVGKTEAQLKKEGIDFSSGTFPFRANGRAMASGAHEGFVRVLAEQKTDRIVGAHIFGPHASELIAEVTIAMEFGASAEDIARTVHTHPTLAEAVREAALDLDHRAIHLPPAKTRRSTR